MATYEQGQTTDATPLLIHVVSAGDEAGTIQKEIHWSAFTSESECAYGEATLFWAKDAGMPPVLKLNSNDILSSGYGAAVSLSGGVSGNDCRVFVTGLPSKVINWSLLIESESQVIA
jgi:hypothetical protein